MKTHILGIGDFTTISVPGEAIKTFSLGSCVAVIICDPKTGCVAMDHIALPDSSINMKISQQKPGYFADTGIPAMIESMKKSGSNGNYRGFIVKLAGGANVLDTSNTFNIGKRNILAIKKILWRYGMGALSEDIGGNISRTVEVNVNTKMVTITSPGKQSWQL